MITDVVDKKEIDVFKRINENFFVKISFSVCFLSFLLFIVYLSGLNILNMFNDINSLGERNQLIKLNFVDLMYYCYIAFFVYNLSFLLINKVNFFQYQEVKNNYNLTIVEQVNNYFTKNYKEIFYFNGNKNLIKIKLLLEDFIFVLFAYSILYMLSSELLNTKSYLNNYFEDKNIYLSSILSINSLLGLFIYLFSLLFYKFYLNYLKEILEKSQKIHFSDFLNNQIFLIKEDNYDVNFYIFISVVIALFFVIFTFIRI